MMLSRITLATALGSFLGALPGAASDPKKADARTTNTDVVIVGGGAAGTYAAIQLFDKGVDVVVVEKQSDLGGHADTYVDPTTGTPLNVGVQVLHNTSFVRQYAARLGVALQQPSGSNDTTLGIDFRTGQQVASPLADAETYTALAQYLNIRATNFSYLEKGFYLPDPVPNDLLIPFGDFAVKYGVEKSVFLLNLYTQGWDISKVPAVYALVIASQELTGEILNGGDFLTTSDINDLYRSAAKILGSRVLLNSNIQSVSRRDGSVTVKIHQNGTSKTIHAKKLLMTGPPLLHNLKGWDLTAEEATLFRKFDTYGYYAGVVSNPSFPDATSFTNIAANSTFHNPQLPALFGISDTPFANKTRTVYYATHPNVDAHKAADRALADVDSVVQKLGYGTAKTKLLAWYPHGPFNLEVSATEIQRGFYRRLYGLQGKTSTWWSGATWQAQDSSQIWYYTATLIDALAAK
jgi:hypothetical protein